MTISQTIKFPIWSEDTRCDTTILLCWQDFVHGSMLFLLHFWSGKGGENGVAFFRTVDLSVLAVVQVWILALEGTTWLEVVMGDTTIICVAPFAAVWSRARMGVGARRRPWRGVTPFSGKSVRAQQRGVVVVHSFVALPFAMIVFAVIFLLVGFFFSLSLC